MKTNFNRSGAERELEALRVLARQIRGEVDAAIHRTEIGGQEDGFAVSRYRGRPVGLEGGRWNDMCKPPYNPRRDGGRCKRVDKPAPKARPGEVPLWQFMQVQMRKWGVSKNTIYGWFQHGLFKGLKVRKAGRRYVFVRVPKRFPAPAHVARSGEVPLKEFVAKEMERLGIRATTIYMRIERNGYPDLVVRRVNQRVVFVKEILTAETQRRGDLNRIIMSDSPITDAIEEGYLLEMVAAIYPHQQSEVHKKYFDKVRTLERDNNQLRAERDNLLLCWNGSLQDTFEMTGTEPWSRTEQSDLNNQARTSLKQCAEALNRLWEEDEMGFIVADGVCECVKCGASAAGESVINHEEWCEQSYIGKALSLPCVQAALKESKK